MSHEPCVLHITDPHLLGDADARLHGWQVQQAFDTVLAAALDAWPTANALILGGDLVDDESEAGYRRLGRQLAALGLPILAMAGNHDDPGRMARCMPESVVHGRLILGDWQLLALDTHVDADAAGRPSPATLARLAGWLADDSRWALIGLHHPPGSLGSAWLDAIGLRDVESLWQALEHASQVAGLICGHAHQEARATIAGVPAWVTPSTMRQFLPGAARFTEDRFALPGYRRLVLRRDGRIDTEVHRVAAAARARD